MAVEAGGQARPVGAADLADSPRLPVGVETEASRRGRSSSAAAAMSRPQRPGGGHRRVVQWVDVPADDAHEPAHAAARRHGGPLGAEDLDGAREAGGFLRHPRRHQPARAARPAPHPARHRAARRRQGARRRRDPHARRDWFVVSQVLSVNPASAVRGPKHVVTKGPTPGSSSPAEARKLLESIDTAALAEPPGPGAALGDAV